MSEAWSTRGVSCFEKQHYIYNPVPVIKNLGELFLSKKKKFDGILFNISL